MILSLKEIAELVGGSIEGDSSKLIHGIGALDSASSSQISYAVDDKYKDSLIKSNAGAFIVDKHLKKYCQKARDISNRRLAIQTAISEMHQKDILIIAGKGHEKYQIIKNTNYLFDDFKVAKNFIK